MYEMNDLVLSNSAPNPMTMQNAHGLGLLDFFNDTNDHNIDQFVNLIRRESFADFDHLCSTTSTADHDRLMINECSVDHDDDRFGPITGLFDALPSAFVEETKGHHGLERENRRQDQEEDINDEDDQSSETAKTDKSKRDRSKTLVSERRRRGRMKEKLYALRSLVPNITKMDKASIVVDAARYVKELQMQAKNLRDEIEGLEASHRASTNNLIAINYNQRKFHQLIPKTVIQMDIFQVEERRFYMRLVCNKGDGIVMSLYKALESLTSLNAQSSNLASATDTIELTVTLRVTDSVREISLPDLKLWVVGALFNEGFKFK